MKNKLLAFSLGVLLAVGFGAWAQDWYQATGKPVQRSQLNSADLRNEFASIETDIADQMPALTGNGDKPVIVNSGGTALTVGTGDYVDETSGSFTVDYDDACSTTESHTWTWLKHGNLVVIDASTLSGCTSDSIQFRDTTTPIPAALRPTSEVAVMIRVQNSGTAEDGCVKVGVTGSVTIQRFSGIACSTVFTASGVKGAYIGTFSYNVDN